MPKEFAYARDIVYPRPSRAMTNSQQRDAERNTERLSRNELVLRGRALYRMKGNGAVYL
jgi:hypothetical protein